jgi:flagellar biosynthetic protein FliS
MDMPSEPLAEPLPAKLPEIPEHVVVLLLEGGQRFLVKAGEAILGQDPMVRDYHLKKTLIILEELNRRLSPDTGGELVTNLARVYHWWGREIVDASEQNDVNRLRLVASQMGEIRKAWEQLLFRGEGLTENPEF